MQRLLFILKTFLTVKLSMVSEHVIGNSLHLGEISGSHGSQYEDGYLLGCCTV
jgi:hypothetical protein